MGQTFSVRRPQNGAVCGVLRAQERQTAPSLEPSEGDLWLVVGLGNPGTRYAGNRHNVGFQAIDEIARREGVSLKKLQYSAAIVSCSVGRQRVLLVKPMTFMNNSGESVGKLTKYYKVPPRRVMVIYDDLDTECSRVRLRAKGGTGGHNGMKSLVQHLGGNEFPRIRIGIGRPTGGSSVIQHVLQDFRPDEEPGIRGAIEEAIATLAAVFEFGMERALSGLRTPQ